MAEIDYGEETDKIEEKYLPAERSSAESEYSTPEIVSDDDTSSETVSTNESSWFDKSLFGIIYNAFSEEKDENFNVDEKIKEALANKQITEDDAHYLAHIPNQKSFDRALKELNQIKESDEVITANIWHKTPIYNFYQGVQTGRYGPSDLLEREFASIKGIPYDSFDLNKAIDDAVETGRITEDEVHRFVDCQNREQFDNALEFLEIDKHDAEVLANVSGAGQFAGDIISCAIDPTTYVGGSLFKLLKWGTPLVKSVIAGTFFSSLDYSIRSDARNEFEALELGKNAAIGAITASILHGVSFGAGKLFEKITGTVGERLKPEDIFGEFIKDEDGHFYQMVKGVKERVPEIVEKILINCPQHQMENFVDKLIEMGVESKEIVKLLKDLHADIFAMRIKNPLGTGEINPISIEEKINLYELHKVKTAQKIDKLKASYVRQGGTAEEFNEQVMKLVSDTPIKVVNGKLEAVQINDPSINKYVAEAVTEHLEFLRKYFQEALDTKTIKLKFFEEGVTTKMKVVSHETLKGIKPENEHLTSFGHILRIYNEEALTLNEAKVRELLEVMYRQNNPTWTQKTIDKHIARDIARMSGHAIEVEAEKVASSSTASPFQKRTIAITDKLLNELGILQLDPINFYQGVRSIVTKSEFNRVAQKRGCGSWDNYLEKLKNSIEEEIGRVQGLGEFAETPKEAKIVQEKREKLNSTFQEMMTLITDSKKIVEGKYEVGNPWWNALASNFRCLTFIQKGGKIFVSCIPDMGMLAMYNGLGYGGRKFLKDFSIAALNGIIRGVSYIPKVLRLPKVADFIKSLQIENVREIEKLIGITDKTLARNMFVEWGGVVGKEKGFIEKFLTGASEKYAGFTGLNSILRSTKNSFMEVAYDNLIKQCCSAKPDYNLLAKMGISQEGALKIKNAYKVYGYEKDGLSFLDLKHLNDEKLADQITASLMTISDQALMIPASGNLPKILRTPMGRFLSVFKTYPFLVYNNLLRNLGDKEVRRSGVLKGLLSATALAIGARMFKDYLNEKESDLEDTDFWLDALRESPWDFFVPAIVDDMLRLEDLKYGREALTSAFPAVDTVNRFLDLARGNKSIEDTVAYPIENTWWMKLGNRILD